MTDPNQLLWNHAIENENWDEAARLQKIAEGLGQSSVKSAQNAFPIATETLSLEDQP